jgi:hypothetical protein
LKVLNAARAGGQPEPKLIFTTRETAQEGEAARLRDSEYRLRENNDFRRSVENFADYDATDMGKMFYES